MRFASCLLILYSLLSSISVPESKRMRALYAILRTQADYKNYRDIPDDAMISEACNYYGYRKKSHHAAMAWYSRGCVLSLTDDELGTISSYLTARDLFPDTLNRYYVICEHNLGKQYLARHLYSEAMPILELSLKNAQTIGDDVTAAYSQYNIALIDMYEKRFDKAEAAFSQLAGNKNLSRMLCIETNLQLAKIYLHHHGNTDKALYYVDRYINEVGFPTGAGYSIKADIFYAEDKYDSAYYYYLRSLECETELSTESNSYSRLPELSLILGHEDKTASAGIFNVAIGAGYFLSPWFSIEAGGTYNNLTFDSSDEVGGGSLGGFATLVFHKSIGGNLKYIPQLQTQYSHIFVEQYRFNFLEVGLAPLAFEYRADDSSLGVTASIGSLGVAFPLSDTADTFKPSYTLNLNSVSLGLVFYF